MWRSSDRSRISSKVSDFHDQDESIMISSRQDPTAYVEELRQIKDQLKGQDAGNSMTSTGFYVLHIQKNTPIFSAEGKKYNFQKVGRGWKSVIFVRRKI